MSLYIYFLSHLNWTSMSSASFSLLLQSINFHFLIMTFNQSHNSCLFSITPLASLCKLLGRWNGGRGERRKGGGRGERKECYTEKKGTGRGGTEEDWEVSEELRLEKGRKKGKGRASVKMTAGSEEVKGWGRGGWDCKGGEELRKEHRGGIKEGKGWDRG